MKKLSTCARVATVCGLVAALLGCGGGSGSASTTAPVQTTISGIVIDGTLKGASVFLDLNGNGVKDAGEPSTTTDANGTYTLQATAAQLSSASVVATAVAGTTVDSDNPGVTVASNYSLAAPPGNYQVISPITTLVLANTQSAGSVAAAEAAVASMLNISSSALYANYVANGNGAVHNVAAALAQVIASVQAQSSSGTSPSAQYQSLNSLVTSHVVPNLAAIAAAGSPAAAAALASQDINFIYSVGGSLSGLHGSGLVLANGTGNVSPAAGASTFVLPNLLEANASYDVTVLTQPASQTCSVANGLGQVTNASISGVQVTCVDNVASISGLVSGLTSSGLVLQDGSSTVAIPANASTFGFSDLLDVGASYTVSVQSQPAGQTCGLSNATGTMGSYGANNVQVTCSTQSYSLGGSISGLAANGLVLQSGGQSLAVVANATNFAFSSPAVYGSAYGVTVSAQPEGFTCSVANGSGTMPAANVTSVAVSCSPQTFGLSGTASGVVSTLSISDGSETVVVPSGASSFSFSTPLAFGSSYAVNLAAAPTWTQACILSNATGTVTGDVTNLAIACAAARAQVITLAGMGSSSGSTGSADGQGSAASFNAPQGIVVDGSGALYVADWQNNEIRKITASGIVSTLAGSTTAGSANGTGAAALFNQPFGLAMDSNGNLYVGDANAGGLRKVTPTGVVTTIPLAGYSAAVSSTVTSDAAGNIYVKGSSSIYKITPSGTVTTISVTGGFGNGMAAGKDGTIYMFDSHRIAKYVAGVGMVTLAGSSTGGSADGQGSAASFNIISGIAVDANGYVYVADTGNGLVRMVSPTGNVTTLAGSAAACYGTGCLDADGIGSQALLYMPTGIAIDGSGTLYVTDFSQVRKLIPIH